MEYTHYWLILIINMAKFLSDALIIKINITGIALKAGISIPAFNSQLSEINAQMSEHKNYLMQHKLSSDEGSVTSPRTHHSSSSIMSNDSWGSNENRRLKVPPPSMYGYPIPPFSAHRQMWYPGFQMSPPQPLRPFFQHPFPQPFLGGSIG